MKLTLRAWPVSAIAFAGFVLLVPFEDFGTGLRALLLWAAAIFTVIDLAPSAAPGKRGENIRRHLARFLWAGLLSTLFLLIPAAVLLIRSDARHLPDLARRIVPFTLVLPFLCFGAITVFDTGIDLSIRDSERLRRLEQRLWILLGLWGAWVVFTGAAGINSKESFRMVFKENGIYFLAYALVILQMRSGAFPNLWVDLLIAAGAFISISAVILGILGYAAPDAWVEFLGYHEWIRLGWTPSGTRIVRVQFPFGSHNRLASFLLIPGLLIPIAYASSRSTAKRIFLSLACIVTLAAVLLTGTRGAMIAAAAGLAIAGTGRSKWTLPALLLCLLPLIIFSAGIRHQIGSIFNPDTYKTDANVRLRIEAWKTSMQIIGDHPVTGIGYGWPNFESIYPHYNAEKLDTEDKPHAHNNFLEIAVETGLTGTTIFIAWQLMLLYGVFLLIRDAASGTPERALGWALLGLMVSIHLFGMTNYSLRRNVGFEIWLGWGILHAGLTSALQRLWWEKENSNAPIPFG